MTKTRTQWADRLGYSLLALLALLVIGQAVLAFFRAEARDAAAAQAEAETQTQDLAERRYILGWDHAAGWAEWWQKRAAAAERPITDYYRADWCEPEYVTPGYSTDDTHTAPWLTGCTDYLAGRPFSPR